MSNTKPKKTTLKINSIVGETAPQQRRRMAVAINDLLSKDALLREEIAALMSIESDKLNWRYNIKEERQPQSNDCTFYESE